ncbi:putative adenosine deaminase protein [Podospora aff. communis PSN243]|uniref:Adenosine deaminase protein n=1 Tax=Podospora aff. communis PSN243 TaxID=3040156 RepID=A0AAV9H798_9PEZI|nr:putative adenosine deaminase protein [Podospora aff. communis PSN243]
MTQLKNPEDAPIDFIALPKIELHAHLSGSISRQTLHEIWLLQQPHTTLPDPLLVMPPGKHDFDLTAFFPLFSSYTYHLINSPSSLSYATSSVLRDFAADGVVYLELRTTPRAIPSADMTKSDYVRCVLETIVQFEREDKRMRTKLILSVDRRNSLPEAQETVALAVEFMLKGVVGLDLCGDPAVGGIERLAPAFAEARRAAPGLGLTLHFAEAECSGSGEELEMLLGWGPQRIGHVIHVSEGMRERIVKRGGMGLELCLSCNVHAGMVCGGFEGHHFGEWWKVDNVAVILCTDDVGVFGSPLSNEYALVAEHFGLERADICALARRGIDTIFGGEEEKVRLREILWSG